MDGYRRKPTPTNQLLFWRCEFGAIPTVGHDIKSWNLQENGPQLDREAHGVDEIHAVMCVRKVQLQSVWPKILRNDDDTTVGCQWKRKNRHPHGGAIRSKPMEDDGIPPSFVSENVEYDISIH